MHSYCRACVSFADRTSAYVSAVKKEKSFQISKNIGRIFRGYNIVEFKSPEDYMSIDDFYKVYGYACFYKADTGNEDKIAIEELTITLVSVRYPIKLINHLKSARGLVVEAVEEGIYYVIGDIIPIQIIVTSRLSDEKNLWLKNMIQLRRIWTPRLNRARRNPWMPQMPLTQKHSLMHLSRPAR